MGVVAAHGCRAHIKFGRYVLARIDKEHPMVTSAGVVTWRIPPLDLAITPRPVAGAIKEALL
jgi:hypothetical protein